MVVGLFEVLLPGTGSWVGEPTAEVLVIEPGAWDAATAPPSVIGWAKEPLVRPEAVEQPNPPPDTAPHTQPVPVAETSVSPDGSVSVTVSGPTASDGPWFWIEMV